MAAKGIYYESIKYYSVIFILGLTINQSFGQNEVSVITSSQTSKFDLPFTISPDSYAMNMGKFGKKWNNKVGGEFGVLRLLANKVNFSFLCGGFVNIHDFDPNRRLSWQLWRANLGVSSFFEYLPFSKMIGKSSHCIIEIDYNHESQHATDVISYVDRFTYMNIYGFNNGGSRSFEFYKLQANYYSEDRSGNWVFDFNGGYKYFPQPKLVNAKRILLNAFLFETGIQRRALKRTFGYCKFYYESIQNRFVAAEMLYKGGWDKEPFQYRIAEIGVNFDSQHNQLIELFMNWQNSNGRGLDFPEIDKVFGYGFRVSL